MSRTQEARNPPPRRAKFTFVAHPTRPQLVLFGGEFWNLRDDPIFYNDLHFYDINTNTWIHLETFTKPSRRSGHQMVATPLKKGQLWMFGGKAPSHKEKCLGDLWLFKTATEKWKKIKTSGGPCERNGHSMVYFKQHLVVYGGSALDPRECYRDVYTFNIRTNEWTKIIANGIQPEPVPKCSMVALGDSRMLLFAYSRNQENFWNFYTLTPNDPRGTSNTWKWSPEEFDEFEAAEGTSIIPLPDSDTDCVCVGGKIYKKGRKPGLLTYNSIDVINCESLPTRHYNWSYCQKLNTGVAIKNGKLYVYGGMSKPSGSYKAYKDFHSLDLKELDGRRVRPCVINSDRTHQDDYPKL